MAFVSYPKTVSFDAFKADILHKVQARTQLGLEGPPPPVAGNFMGTVKLHGKFSNIWSCACGCTIYSCQVNEGTNSTIIFKDNNRHNPQYQSRNRVLNGGIDNQGTVSLLENAPLNLLINEMLRIRNKGEDFDEIMIAGEIGGKGIQAGVAITRLPRFFAIFNIRIDGHWVDLKKYKTVHLPKYQIFNLANYPSYEVYIDLTKDTTAVVKAMQRFTDQVVKSCPFAAAFPGVEKKNGMAILGGEGIVWTLQPKVEHGGRLYNFKTKGETFSATNRGHPHNKAKNQSDNSGAESFVDFVLGERRLEQGIEYLEEMQKDATKMENLGLFMKWVQADVLKEEGWRLAELGLTEKEVSKVVAERARIWYRTRNR